MQTSALDWRLWVGIATMPAAPATTKPVSRSQSEPTLLVTPPALRSDARPPFIASGLRRSSILPSGALTPPSHHRLEKPEPSYNMDCSLYALINPYSQARRCPFKRQQPGISLPTLLLFAIINGIIVFRRAHYTDVGVP
jgi:hypothetical protein